MRNEVSRSRKGALQPGRLIDKISSPRAARVEKRRLQRDLERAEKRIQELEDKLNILTNDDQYVSFEDQGRRLIQDQWNRSNCSRALAFPAPASCTCPSVEEDFSLAAMPGVHGVIPMTSGLYSQPILVRGGGYTLVGLVGSDAEKEAIKTCDHWSLLPTMSPVGYFGVEVTLVLEVDMVNHSAELYAPKETPGHLTIVDHRDSQELEVIMSWRNLSPQVWVSVAMKRNSQREAVLLPRTHWDLQELG